MTKRIAIAKISGSHGVKGLVKLTPFGDDIKLVEYCGEYKITLKNRVNKYWLAKIDGIDNPEDATKLSGTEIFIDKSHLPEIEDKDSFYYEDLIGLNAIDTERGDMGEVIGVHNYGAGDLLEIRPTAQSGGGQSFLLPFNNDTIGEITDIQIEITIPEGLLDL